MRNLKLVGTTKIIAALAISMLMALFLAAVVFTVSEGKINPLPIAIALFVAGTVLQFGLPKKAKSKYAFAITVELWVQYIQENFFKDDEFMSKCFDESDAVLGGAVVHLPQAGAKPTVVKNRTRGVAATATLRTDSDITYALNDFTTDPTVITEAESKEISYDKMGSVLSEHMETLRETVGDDLLIQWCANLATGSILRTTGTAVATALAPSATGTRLKFLKEDLARAQTLMNKQNVSKADRYALIPSDMMAQLKEDADLKTRDFALELNLKDGVIGRLYGFNIMERSATPVFTNATPPVVKALGAAAAATDNLAVICWQKNAVAKALGAVKFFENTDDPTFYGSLYSAFLKMGGRARRTGNEGVVAIVQTP